MLAGMSLLTTGCGPNRAAVNGTVYVDGVPVDQGTISFIPEGHGGRPVANAIIENGKFSISEREGPVVGRNSIVITGGRRTGRKVEMPPDEFDPQSRTIDEIEEIVPEKYREVSVLVREIASSGNTIELNLDSR